MVLIRFGIKIFFDVSFNLRIYLFLSFLSSDLRTLMVARLFKVLHVLFVKMCQGSDERDLIDMPKI